LNSLHLVSGIREKLAGLYYGWRMIGLVSALRVLGGGLHQYGFTVSFYPSLKISASPAPLLRWLFPWRAPRVLSLRPSSAT
jgi:hypothetical protein